jgi:hypothetical protein
MTQALETATRLLVVQEILEDENGATLRFEQGGHGRLSSIDPHYPGDLELARRSKERGLPVGVAFGEGNSITELSRADSDVPEHVEDEGSESVLVFFQGHDGIFQLRRDRQDFPRLRGLLTQAIREKARVWFVTQDPELTLQDVARMPEGVRVTVAISFVSAPPHLLKKADQILRSRISGKRTVSRNIRAVAKAYIDEADEISRAVRESVQQAENIQLETRSPEATVAKANALRTVRLADKKLQEMVREVATSYVMIAKENTRRFEEFKAQLAGQLSQQT